VLCGGGTSAADVFYEERASVTVQEKAPSAFSKKLQIICGLGLVLLLAYMGVSGLTLREVPCPSNMASDIGTPVAMGFMEAWER
jgi:hypothetical protein